MTAAMRVMLSKKGQFVIPKGMRDALRAKEGDELLVNLEGRAVVLIRPQEYARATCGLLKGTWSGNQKAVDLYLQKERRSWR